MKRTKTGSTLSGKKDYLENESTSYEDNTLNIAF